MGTRGICGFKIDEVLKVQYVQYDSYPTGLGKKVVGFFKNHGWESLEAQVRALKVVGKKPPTQEQKETLSIFAGLHVGNQSLDDWYCLLRKTQGQLDDVLKAGHILDASEDLGPETWCEYGYVLNFDTKKLDFYVYKKGKLSLYASFAEKEFAGADFVDDLERRLAE